MTSAGLPGLAGVAVLAAVAAALLWPGRPRLLAEGDSARAAPPGRGDLVRRGAWWWGALAGSGSAAVVGGALALPAGVVVAVVVATAARRLEPATVRRDREAARRDLPRVVCLLGSALRSGLAPGDAVDLVVRALPGAAAERLRPWAARLRLGADAAGVWAGLAADPALGALGRALARAHRTGAPVADAVDDLAVELAGLARAEVEDRARSVGVRAAVPLGVCLLPAFVLLGIVPLVVGLAGALV